MPRMLVNWEHAEDRNVERVQVEHRPRVQKLLDMITTLEAPAEAVGHYSWYIEIYGPSNEVVAILINRGIAVRTVYSPDLNMRPPFGATRYKIDKIFKKFVKA